MKIKEIILGVIIAAIFLMFSVYGTRLVYESPEYSDYCDEPRFFYPEKIMPAGNCTQYALTVNEKSQQCYSLKGNALPVYNEEGCQTDVVCDFCNRDYEEADENYSKNLFIISLIFSVVIIVISVVLIEVPSVYGGLMLGSFAFIIYGTARYWRFMNDWLRFIILGAVLIILIGVAYWLARKSERSRKK